MDYSLQFRDVFAASDFLLGGLVLRKCVPARCERGDCLFHLAIDLKE